MFYFVGMKENINKFKPVTSLLFRLLTCKQDEEVETTHMEVEIDKFVVKEKSKTCICISLPFNMYKDTRNKI